LRKIRKTARENSRLIHKIKLVHGNNRLPVLKNLQYDSILQVLESKQKFSCIALM
jgi:hypothetical protein